MKSRRDSVELVRSGSTWLIVAVAAIVFLCGLLWQSTVLLVGGAVFLCILLRQIGSPSRVSTKYRRDWQAADPPVKSSEAIERPRVLDRLQASPAPLQHGWARRRAARHAPLRAPPATRNETASHAASYRRAVRQLDESMALVPAGRVLLGQLAEQSHSACGPMDTDPKLIDRNLVDVPPVYLDRFCVTNEEYQRFVDAGGYEQLEFWHEEALLPCSTSSTNPVRPAPVTGATANTRATKDGCRSSASAGSKQLPTPAGSASGCRPMPSGPRPAAWPVESAPGRIAQRRYPWGESFDVRRAHLFGSGQSGPVAVEEYPGGTSVGGIHQLIGNVWEWTSTPLSELTDSSLHVSESVMSIRGGAFDTYFENQATCHFQSGEQSLSRRRNIGFRLALPMSDLEPVRDDEPQQATDEPVAEAAELETAVVACEIRSSKQLEVEHCPRTNPARPLASRILHNYHVTPCSDATGDVLARRARRSHRMPCMRS